MTRRRLLDCVGGIAGDMLLGGAARRRRATSPRCRRPSRARPRRGRDRRSTRTERHGIARAPRARRAADGPPDRDLARHAGADRRGRLPERAAGARAGRSTVSPRPRRRSTVSPSSDVALPRARRRSTRSSTSAARRPRSRISASTAVACSPLPYAARPRASGARRRCPCRRRRRWSCCAARRSWASTRRRELVTPTGAALAPRSPSAFGALPPMMLEPVGYGAGTRDLADRPNVVRVLLGATEPAVPGRRSSLLETNLDDLIPELVPDAVERVLRGRRARRLDGAGADEEGTPGRRAVARSPGPPTSARSRPTRPATNERPSACGSQRLRRYELDRGMREVVEVDGRAVRVKLGLLDGRGRQRRARARRLRRGRATRTGRPVKAIWAEALARPRRGPRRPRSHDALSSLDARTAQIADRLGSAVVAFSGGVDSSLVAALAARALGDRALAVTAVSPALATGELDGARGVAAAVGIAPRDDHDRRARARGLPAQRSRPLLPLQDRALRPARGARGAGGVRGPALGRQRRRSRRLAAGPAGRAPSTAFVHPLLEAGFGKARRARRWPERSAIPSADKPAMSVPRLAAAVRHAGRPRDARAGRSGRAGGPRARATGTCACATSADRAGRAGARGSRAGRDGPERATRSCRRCVRAGYEVAEIDERAAALGIVHRQAAPARDLLATPHSSDSARGSRAVGVW